MSYIIGRNSAGGGGTGSTPSWSDISNKPFNTVGEGLEVNNGSLKEAVPLYEETSSEEQTSTAEGYPSRQEITHYSDTYTWYEDRILPKMQDATSVPQFEFSYEYDDGGIPTSVSYSSSSLTPSDFLNGFSATDSAGNQWTVSLHDYQLQFEKGSSNIAPYELSVSIEIYVDGEGNYNVSGTAFRESWSEYTDSFIYSDDRLISYLLGASDISMEFTYWDGSQDQTLYVNHLDLTDTSSDYEQDGLHWNIYADEWSIYFNCTNGLPSDAGTRATVQFTYTHTVETTTVHKLPAKYVPIDNNTIQVDWNGNLYANVSGGVSSVWYETQVSGTQIGNLYVDGSGYSIEIPMPPCPSETQGTYVLQAQVDEYGSVTYSWVPQT